MAARPARRRRPAHRRPTHGGGISVPTNRRPGRGCVLMGYQCCVCDVCVYAYHPRPSLYPSPAILTRFFSVAVMGREKEGGREGGRRRRRLLSGSVRLSIQTHHKHSTTLYGQRTDGATTGPVDRNLLDIKVYIYTSRALLQYIKQLCTHSKAVETNHNANYR